MNGRRSRSGWALVAVLCALSLGCDGPTAQAHPAPSGEVPMTPKVSKPPKKPNLSCPKEMVTVSGFCIDRWEAHTVLADNPSERRSPYETLRDGEKLIAKSAPGVTPQGYINRIEASAACKAAGKRLCRAKEWYRACAGEKHRRWPYAAKKEDRDSCNTRKGHVLTKVFGKKVFFTKISHYNNPKVNQEPGFLALTGAHDKCVTPEGALDMVGNLHEWVADDVSSALPEQVPLEYGEHRLGPRGSGVFMGGYYSSKNEHGRGCAYTTATHAPDYHDYSIGFRCCRYAKQKR